MQRKQRCPNLPLPHTSSSSPALLQSIPSHSQASRDIVSPACPGPSPDETCLDHLPRKATKGHPKQKEQRLYSELLLSDSASHPISKGAPSHPAEETHFGYSYPRSCPFVHYPNFLTIGESEHRLTGKLRASYCGEPLTSL